MNKITLDPGPGSSKSVKLPHLILRSRDFIHLLSTVLIVITIILGVGLSRQRQVIFSRAKDLITISEVPILANRPIAFGIVDNFSRMKTNLSQGVYDDVSNTTYIVYPGGLTSEGLSETAPHIRSYNHTNKTWSPEIKISSSPLPPDSHFYPQLTIDNEGYLHVFNTFHANHNILHAKSLRQKDIKSWNVNYIPQTNNATYGAVFKAKNGEIYLFYRQTLIDDHPDWYEPEAYIKSVDNGLTWTYHTIIDPGHNEDNWNSTYLKSMKYQSDPEGIHIAFGVHKEHNTYFNKHYYIFFSLEDNHVYGPNGDDFGVTIERSEFESCCLIFHYGRQLEFSQYSINPIAITFIKDDSLKNGNYPIIFYTYYKTNQPNTFKAELRQKIWTGSRWITRRLTQLGDILFPLEAEYINQNNLLLYLRHFYRWEYWPTYVYNYDNSAWKKIFSISNIRFQPGSGVGHMGFITNGRQDLKGTFINNKPPVEWYNPLPNGVFYTFEAPKLFLPEESL